MMRRLGVKGFIVICISFIVAFVLAMLPFPEWLSWYEPQWVLLILLFWLINFPEKINMGIAFCLGLGIDILNGALLGEHAFAITIVSYLALRHYRSIKNSPLVAQTLFVFALVFLYQLIIFVIQGVLGQIPMSMSYWLSSITSMLFWPWVNIIGHQYSSSSRVSFHP